MTKAEIEQLGEELAKKYNPEGLSPFPFENVTKSIPELDIIFTEISEIVSGAITFDKKRNSFAIIINNIKPKTRQHFTTAHELGHYFLHRDLVKTDSLIDGDSSLDGSIILYRADVAQPVDKAALETEANNFAASLIMPKELVIKAWQTFRDVEECAKIFCVSVSAMSIRLERLKILTS